MAASQVQLSTEGVLQQRSPKKVQREAIEHERTPFRIGWLTLEILRKSKDAKKREDIRFRRDAWSASFSVSIKSHPLHFFLNVNAILIVWFSAFSVYDAIRPETFWLIHYLIIWWIQVKPHYKITNSASINKHPALSLPCTKIGRITPLYLWY